MVKWSLTRPFNDIGGAYHRHFSPATPQCQIFYCNYCSMRLTTEHVLREHCLGRSEALSWCICVYTLTDRTLYQLIRYYWMIKTQIILDQFTWRNRNVARIVNSVPFHSLTVPKIVSRITWNNISGATWRGRHQPQRLHHLVLPRRYTYKLRIKRQHWQKLQTSSNNF